MKRCPRCKLTKRLSQFYRAPAQSGGYDGICRRCRIADSRRRGRENPQAVRARSRSHFRRQRGWTDELIRQRFREQVGCCAICCADLGSTDKAHADHDHVTGRARGLLCPDCNFGLGRFRDNPDDLARAIAYLNDHDPKGPTP